MALSYIEHQVTFILNLHDGKCDGPSVQRTKNSILYNINEVINETLFSNHPM